MAKPNNISLKNPYIRDNLIGTNKLLGIYTGYTRDHKDESQLRGRIAVFIPAFFDCGETDDVSANWFNCEWASPFWGQTFRGNRGKDEKNYTNSQSTYGMWMIPPDPGTEVLVSFRDGNIKMPVIVGCPINNQYNYSVPGYPGGISYGDPAINAPVTEKNLNADPGKHGPNVPRPMHADIAEQITQQGLINDNIRGAGKSGARRESPSRVFGILTPGDWDNKEPETGEGKVRKAGHQFVMDDINGSRMIRLRSGGGNQILLSDDTQSIYCINSRGEVWWEMDNSGNFSLYAKRGINIRTQGDFNLRADGSVNIEGGGDVNIKAAGDMRADQYVGGAIQEALGAFGVPTVGNGGRVNITGKQSLQLYGDRNVRMTAGGGDIDLNAGNSINLEASGASVENGAGINLESPFTPICIHSGLEVQLQSEISVEGLAPVISLGGGIINLNTSPPNPMAWGLAHTAFKLPGKPLQDVDDELVPFSREAAKQGASAFPTQGKREGIAPDVYTIVTKLITAEPYIGHDQADPIKKASDPDFYQRLVDNLPPGSTSDTANPAPGDVVIPNPADPNNPIIKKGIGYVDEAGNAMASAQDQIQGAYDQAQGQFDQATAGIQGEIDAVKTNLAEQFPEYEQYADAFNNLGALLDSDLSAIQRIDILIGMLGAVIPPIRFPTSNQLEEDIVGLNSKLSELEAKLSQYGLDADQLIADLMTGNIAGLKSQAMGIFNEVANTTPPLDLAGVKKKFADSGLDVTGLSPTDPMFPSIAVTDKDGNTFVDFSKGMSDPAAALLAGGKLATEFAKVEQEIGTFTNLLGDTQKSGLTSFVNGLGGSEKFLESNVGKQLKQANDLLAFATNTGGAPRTPEQQSAFDTAMGIQANVPRLMSGWVLAAETPGGKMVYNQDLANQRAVEIDLFTATDDMNLKSILNESVPGGENYGTLLQKIRAAKRDYFANKTATGKDTELGKIVKSTSV